MTVSGFKCFRDEQHFEFGDVTYITGDNHVGKTSIADAIAFAFCGRLYNGSSAMDRLYSDGAKELSVALHLLDAGGKPIDLVRTRRDDKVTATLNGYNVRQKDIDHIFGESEVFLSIFNPTFFIEYLGGDGQTLLQKYLPLIDHEVVLENMSEAQRKLLASESLLSPETFIANQRENLKEYKEGLIALDGQKALLMRQCQDGKQDMANMLTHDLGEDLKLLGETQKAVLSEMAENEEAYGQLLAAQEQQRVALLNAQADEIRAFAEQHHLSYDEIRADMDENNMSFTEWVEENQKGLDKNQEKISEFADKWSYSLEEVNAAITASGLTIEEYVERQDKALEHAMKIIADFTASTTDGFSTMDQQTAISLDNL